LTWAKAFFRTLPRLLRTHHLHTLQTCRCRRRSFARAFALWNVSGAEDFSSLLFERLRQDQRWHVSLPHGKARRFVVYHACCMPHRRTEHTGLS
jgi:hypothetical protein